MGRVDRYPTGTFCWVDLGVPDVDGARAFYGGLLGWTFEEARAGDEPYTLCRVEGADVAGIHRHGEPDAPPPHWDSYVAVDDAEAALERAVRLGADVVREPFEVPGTARVAAIRDPGGAAVNLWQARGFAGAALVNEPGTWTWNDLSAGDPGRAEAFYRDLFGWEFRRVAPTYWSISMGDLLIGGMRTVDDDPEGAPPHWIPYFVVPEAGRAAARVGELGGSVIVPPTPVPAGRFLVVRDPQGARFALFEMGPQGPARGVDRG